MVEMKGNLRSVIWKLMTDLQFRKEFEDNGVEACQKIGFKLTKKDIETISRIDMEDLDGLLTALERDMTVTMGGSRPRRAIALSDGTISELRTALDEAKKD